MCANHTPYKKLMLKSSKEVYIFMHVYPETLNQTKSVAFTVLYPSTTLKYMSAAIIEIKSPLFFLQDSYVFVAILVFIICSQFCRHYNTFCLWRIFSCYNFMIEAKPLLS